MHILVTNDDGVHAPGLAALADAMRPLGRVTILAPDHNWSGGGHVKTLHRPLRVLETTLRDGTPALMSDGAPSDCVALAMLGRVAATVSYTHLRAHETVLDLACRLLLEKKKTTKPRPRTTA